MKFPILRSPPICRIALNNSSLGKSLSLPPSFWEPGCQQELHVLLCSSHRRLCGASGWVCLILELRMRKSYPQVETLFSTISFIDDKGATLVFHLLHSFSVFLSLSELRWRISLNLSWSTLTFWNCIPGPSAMQIQSTPIHGYRDSWYSGCCTGASLPSSRRPPWQSVFSKPTPPPAPATS